MSAITWSLSDERSGNFDGWGVVRGRLFKLGDRDMSELKNIEIELPEQSNEEIFTNWFVAEFGSPKVVFISKFGNAEYLRIRAAWNAQQETILSLKAQLNNMERCYIEKKKQLNDLQVHIESTCLDDELAKVLEQTAGVNTHKPKAIKQRVYVSFDVEAEDKHYNKALVGKFEGYGAVDYREDGYVFGCLEDGRPFSCPEQYVREVEK